MATESAFRCCRCGGPVQVLNPIAQRLYLSGKAATCKGCMNGNLKRWTKATYAEYLKSDRWQRRRLRSLDKAAYACQVCKSTRLLEVHHNCYDRLGDELDSDLFVVCGMHHDMIHGVAEL